MEPCQDLKDIIREDFLEEMGSTFNREDRVSVSQEKESRVWLRWQVQPGQRPGGLWGGDLGRVPCVVQGGVFPCLGGPWREPGVKGFGRRWVLFEQTLEAVKGVSRK